MWQFNFYDINLLRNDVLKVLFCKTDDLMYIVKIWCL